MSSFVEGSDVMTPERRIADLEEALIDAQRKLDAIRTVWGIEASGTVGNSNSMVFYRRGLRECKCGRRPQIQSDVNEPGMFLVMCPDCVLRTRSHRRIMDAMRDWQDEKYTPATAMLREKLTAQDMSEDGALKLIDGVRTRATEDYLRKLDAGAGPDDTDRAEIELAMPETAERLRAMHAKRRRELLDEGKPGVVMKALGRPKGRSRVKID